VVRAWTLLRFRDVLWVVKGKEAPRQTGKMAGRYSKLTLMTRVLRERGGVEASRQKTCVNLLVCGMVSIS